MNEGEAPRFYSQSAGGLVHHTNQRVPPIVPGSKIEVLPMSLNTLEEIEHELDNRIRTVEIINSSYGTILLLLRNRRKMEQEVVAIMATDEEKQEALLKERVPVKPVSIDEDEYLNDILLKARLIKSGKSPREKKPTASVSKATGTPKPNPIVASTTSPEQPTAQEIKYNKLIENTMRLADESKRLNLAQALLPTRALSLIQNKFLLSQSIRIPPHPVFCVLLHQMLQLDAASLFKKAGSPAVQKANISRVEQSLLARNFSDVRLRLENHQAIPEARLIEFMSTWFILHYCQAATGEGRGGARASRASKLKDMVSNFSIQAPPDSACYFANMRNLIRLTCESSIGSHECKLLSQEIDEIVQCQAESEKSLAEDWTRTLRVYRALRLSLQRDSTDRRLFVIKK